jgi:hypothetical protein
VNQYVRTAVLGLTVAVLLIVYLISQISTGTEFTELFHVAVAFDHINFIMVVTNLMFAMMTLGLVVPESANRVIFWGTNVGVAGFAVGIFTENATLKRIFTPILGLALLYGIYTYLTAKEARPVVAQEVGV